MEYKIITPNDSEYPQKLIKRLGDKCPGRIYYNGPLEFLDRFTMAKRIAKLDLPVFTNDSDECKDLHDVGILGFNRETVGTFLEDKGARVATPENKIRESVKLYEKPDIQQLSFIKNSTQTELDFDKHSKDIDS